LRNAVWTGDTRDTRLNPEVTAIPEETFIGRIERGFDFLRYHFGPEGLTLAARTWVGPSITVTAALTIKRSGCFNIARAMASKIFDQAHQETFVLERRRQRP
jgi:hypothetical protein